MKMIYRDCILINLYETYKNKSVHSILTAQHQIVAGRVLLVGPRIVKKQAGKQLMEKG
mgnify:CR=1 FL=1